VPELNLDAEQTRNCFLRSLDSTERFVAAIPESRWASPTPCDEWDVRAVVNHLVYENLWAVELFNGKTIEEVGSAFDGDLVGSDPARAYAGSAAAVKSVIRLPESMSATCQISSGPVSGAEYASQLFLDTLVHGWDIAVGSGQSGELDPGLVEACIPLAEWTCQAVGESGPFGSSVPVSPQENAQVRLLAILGRDAATWG
jgi:uncharacterized protein (TIGR03086 family)